MGNRLLQVTAALSAGLMVMAVGLGRAEAQRGTASVSIRPDPVVKFIDERIHQGWTDNGVSPSPLAEDSEWLRRVYLDIVGHIPPADVVERFLDDRDKAKRVRVIEGLLDDPAYVRNWTTIWTNLCIGRLAPDRVSRAGMQKFFREAFTKNRPWNDIVYDLITAEGGFERNGAVNYLLAQMTMRDQGVQATAKTSRLFLGVQLQCTQCHDHPFNDWKQNQFWEFNSFFRQVRRQDHRKYDPDSGRMVDDYSELVDGNFSGPVYYEKRSGLMQVAYPKYFGREVNPGPDADRRKILGKLLTEGDKPWIARALVNRMWAHFFGYGFTRPVDDMGPHNPPSHPELLDRLTEEFVKSGYDVKQLIRWITTSEAYQLTSRFGKKNDTDDPSAGRTPLFSHMYVKQMSAEQLYDSLIVATNAHESGSSSWEQAEQQRQDWLGQFVIAFNTDENDEATTFNGTIPQALMMMNGDLVQHAIDGKPGGFLYDSLTGPGSDAKKVQKLYLSTLSRYPSRLEMSAAEKLLRANPRNKLISYQDLFWALLNANEFILVH